MKYILVEVQTNADGTVGNIVTAYDDRDTAESNWHLKMSYAKVSTLPVHSVVLITNEGHMLLNGTHKHYASEPEVEEETLG